MITVAVCGYIDKSFLGGDHGADGEWFEPTDRFLSLKGEQMSSGHTFEERNDRFARAVSTRTLQGWNIVDRNDVDLEAVLMLPGKPVNHILHALISIFTCGLWAIAWIIFAITQKREQRIRISIDSSGNILEEALQL